MTVFVDDGNGDGDGSGISNDNDNCDQSWASRR
jgi:hypothetical protein